MSDLRLSPTASEQGLRDEVRAFLAEHAPAPEEVPRDLDEQVPYLRGWQRRLKEARLVGLSWPSEYGGRGGSLSEQIVCDQEMARAGMPQLVGYVGVDVIGPTLVRHGTEAQKATHLERILSAEDIWCQGVLRAGRGLGSRVAEDASGRRGRPLPAQRAEGVDLVRAVRELVRVLARTDPDAAASRGISYLLVDMRSPGVTVTPLVMSTGDAEFGEVFFDDVKVPRENVVGELHRGWPLAMHTLAHERGPYAMTRQVTLSGLLDRLVGAAQDVHRDGRPAIELPEIRLSLARVRIAVEVLKHQTYRSVGRAILTGEPGPESSVDKLMLARAEQLLGDAALEVLGARGADGAALEPWHQLYLYGRAASVYGGTAEVQKNIIAQRVLGLPRTG